MQTSVGVRHDLGHPRVSRSAYLKRILSVYLFPRRGPLSFWYETPEVNGAAFVNGVGQYYMTFRGKADYPGPFDAAGLPLLDYRGNIGLQYNPIAIAQYGLACFNQYKQSSDECMRRKFLVASDWLVENLEVNAAGLLVWHHHFNWPYRQPLIAPWYSGLAQGMGVSLLIRASLDTGRLSYQAAAHAAYSALTEDVACGGVLVRDSDGSAWLEEYLVDPPSHILNGFLWAVWGLYDFARWTGQLSARELFQECVHTIAQNLPRYDTGFWSLYELGTTGP
ncbi:MAG: D-glucuronyl C5-epimerase family protein, partial [Acidimicrobiia bacterium]